jgi:hypothetical protein
MSKQYIREEYLITHSLKCVRDLMGILKDNKIILAGGAITSVFSGSKIRDYDLYFTDFATKGAVEEWFGNNMKESFRTERAISYLWFNPAKKSERHHGDPEFLRFQLITIPGTEGGTSKIFDLFDFTICMGAYRFEDDTFIFHESFMKHIAQRKLCFNNKTKYPINSMIRMKKYVNRGYVMGNIEILKMALTVNSLGITNYKDLKEQLEGIDTMFLKELTDQLWKNQDTVYEFEKVLELMEAHFEKYFSGDYNEEEDGDPEE